MSRLFIHITFLVVLYVFNADIVQTNAAGDFSSFRSYLDSTSSQRYKHLGRHGRESEYDLVATSRSLSCPVTTCSATGGATKFSDLSGLFPGLFKTREEVRVYEKENGLHRPLYMSTEEAANALKGNTGEIVKRSLPGQGTCCPIVEYVVAPTQLVVVDGSTIYPIQDTIGGNYQIISMTHCIEGELGLCSGQCQNTTTTHVLLVQCVLPVECEDGCSTTFHHAELESGCQCIE